MTYFSTDIAAQFFLDDVPGASSPTSRLRGILDRTIARHPLTALQKEFLQQHGYKSLLQFALGELEIEEFRIRAQGERNGRLKAKLKAKSATREKESIEHARNPEVANRKAASLSVERDRELDRNEKLRESFDRFGLEIIDSKDVGRVDRILQAVIRGRPIEKEDILWLGSDGHHYWTNELRKVHHENMARKFGDEWKQTGDVWKAINACSNYRKAELSLEGLSIAKEALTRAAKNKKSRSALLTTGGGAHRDLRNFEDSVRFGAEAHALTPEDFRPCTLLGAVHIEMGAYATGAEWYEEAEARGASRNLIDRELQSILNAAPPEERSKIKKALKALDASRYSRL